jgi:hypothetical protein
MAMKPSFTTKPLPENMVAEKSMDCVGMRYHGDHNYPCIDILCVECGWTGHFGDGSTDHFFNHKCKLRTESISMGD